MEEIWKDVTKQGYSHYEVSNLGRVRSKKGRLRHPRVYSRWGYLKLNLSKGDERKLCAVHRLVAMAFIPNPENKPCVNHKDNDPSNNRVENLEWMTHQENRAHCVAQNRHAKGSRIRNQWSSKV